MRHLRVHPTHVMLIAASCLGAACRAHGRAAPAGDIRYVVAGGSTPEERAARVAMLPRCAPIDPAPASWPIVALTAVPGTIRLPGILASHPSEVPSDAEQAWADSALGDVSLQRDEDAGVSSGFMITPGEEPGLSFVDEGACAQPFDGRLAELRRAFWTSATHAHDTVFVATTDIPVQGDLQLGAGVIGVTRAKRESLLSALASIRLGAP